MNNLPDILSENVRRNALLHTDYDPVLGVGCFGARTALPDGRNVPERLLADHPDFALLSGQEQDGLRVRYDFEYWAATRATIVDKRTGQFVNFRLNAPQRRLLAEMEGMRVAGEPVRVILLKARQWGGSTLVQLYMAWIQLEVRPGWNSLICGHRQNASRGIRQMYRRLLGHYPVAEGAARPALRNVEGSSEVQQLDGRDCLVIIATARSEDAVRGYNLAMAHLTEVAFWPQSAMHNPDDVIRSVCGTVMRLPDTVVVVESTANGTGNYFHSEWLRAKAGRSDKRPVFVPWYEIEQYRTEVTDAEALWGSMDEYERGLWADGLTLEMIQWYHDKRREYNTHAQMMAEFPTNDIEAFSATDSCVFDLARLETLRRGCRPAQATGDVNWNRAGVAEFFAESAGEMLVWQMPEVTASPGRYLVAVDVGGRSDKADWSVIAVFDLHDRRADRPEVVAQWRGHIDHDLLADKAAAIATFYGRALLVVESNTLETEFTELDGGEFVLARLARTYRHLYHRRGARPGFHTNARTKQQAVYTLIQAVREGLYIERDHQAIDEMSTYELTRRGGFEAKPGRHDDILMTRAIALTVAADLPASKPAITEADRRDLLSEALPEG